MLSRFSADNALPHTHRTLAENLMSLSQPQPSVSHLMPLLSHRSLAHDHYESIKPQMMSFRCYERNNIAQVSN